MKKFFAGYLIFLALCSCLDGATVSIQLQTCGILPAANRSLTLTPLQAAGSDTIPVMDKIQGTTDENGNWTPTLMAGVYQVDVRPAWGQVGVTRFYFYVDPSNAVQDAFTHLLTGTNNTYPPNQYAYSAQASDARYALQGQGVAPLFTNNVKDFGAQGDAHFTVNISTTNAMLYSPNGIWTSGDIGDEIMICGAKRNGQSFVTTIINVLSTNNILLGAAVPYNITNQFYCIYGDHDDTVAFQAALNDLTNHGGGYIYVPQGIYLLEGPFQNTNQNNAQVIVPYISASSSPNWGSSAIIEIFGNHMWRNWTDPNGFLEPPIDATVIVSMNIGNDFTGSNYIGSSVLDCRAYNQGNLTPYSYGFSGPGNFTREYRWPDNDAVVILHDLSFLTSYDPHMAVVNLIGGADGSGGYNFNVVGGSPSPIYSDTQPQGTNSYGIIMPGNFNGTFGPLNYVDVSGMWSGIDCGLIDADKCTVNLCSNAYTIMISTPAHANIHLANVSDCSNIITPGHPGFQAPLDVDFAIIQGTTVGEEGWWSRRGYIAALYDPSNYLDGSSGAVPAEISIPTTNANGEAVEFVGSSGTLESYDWYNGAVGGKTALYPEYWLSTNNTVNGAWNYSLEDVYVVSNLATGGSIFDTNSLWVGGSSSVLGNLTVNGDIIAANNGVGLVFNANSQAWTWYRSLGTGLPNVNLFYIGFSSSPSDLSPMGFFTGNASWALQGYSYIIQSVQNGVIGWGYNTNGISINLTGNEYATNGAWTASYLNTITNGMENIMFWEGPSNYSLISLKYSNGACFFNTIQQ